MSPPKNTGYFIINTHNNDVIIMIRTQGQNRKDCMDKLREMIAEAYLEPKEREMWIGISEKGKEKRRDEKRKRGTVKETRRSKNFDFD